MTKSEAIELFGTRQDLIRALGIARKTFYNWEDPLAQDKIDRIRGAYMRVVEERDRHYTFTIGWNEKGVADNATTP